MTTSITGLPVPNPAGVGHRYHVYAAAIDARAWLVSQPDATSQEWPVGYAAAITARDWENAGKSGGIPGMVLAAAICEILALDPVTNEWLRSRGLPWRSCGRKGGRRS